MIKVEVNGKYIEVSSSASLKSVLEGYSGSFILEEEIFQYKVSEKKIANLLRFIPDEISMDDIISFSLLFNNGYKEEAFIECGNCEYVYKSMAELVNDVALDFKNAGLEDFIDLYNIQCVLEKQGWVEIPDDVTACVKIGKGEL